MVWPTRKAIQTTRQRHSPSDLTATWPLIEDGLPIVYAVVDLTCLEKTGKYKDLAGLVRTYNGKRGVHVALFVFGHRSISIALELPGLSR